MDDWGGVRILSSMAIQITIIISVAAIVCQFIRSYSWYKVNQSCDSDEYQANEQNDEAA